LWLDLVALVTVPAMRGQLDQEAQLGRRTQVFSGRPAARRQDHAAMDAVALPAPAARDCRAPLDQEQPAP
jgi:hypothetical protein